MAWTPLKQWFKKQDRQQQSKPSEPEIRWIQAVDNPWGVPVLDVRPVTLTMLSTTSNRQCAENLSSLFHDDGTSFIGVFPTVSRVISGGIQFRIDRVLADGVLFSPHEMEDKWAIYLHRGQILFVRSWQRRVQVIADVNADPNIGNVEITTFRGTFTADDEPPRFTRRVADYLLRSHALDVIFPAPLAEGIGPDLQRTALWCFAMFGRRAHFATPHELVLPAPDKPLRTESLLHLAVARGDSGAIKTLLEAGMPIDLLASDGLAPLHWSLVRDDTSMSELLLECGSPIDVRSDEGATPLMQAVQSRSIVKVSFLLSRGADPNAVDKRGFSALHRAAEMGELPISEVLLRAGASPHHEAQGLTPQALAEKEGHKAIAQLLDRN